jgi:hypothetical protein
MAIAPAETERNFGTVNTGASADAVYTVTNAGTGTLTGAASLAGDTQFQFVGASTYSLSAGAESTVTVRFAPDRKGSFSGTLQFDGNGGTIAVTLAGEGEAKTGLFNCSAGQEAPSTIKSDFLVVFLAASALLLARRRTAQQ